MPWVVPSTGLFEVGHITPWIERGLFQQSFLRRALAPQGVRGGRPARGGGGVRPGRGIVAELKQGYKKRVVVGGLARGSDWSGGLRGRAEVSEWRPKR